MKVRTACLYGIVFLTAGLCLDGCTKEQKESCLTIKKSGAVTHRIVEDFEEENYELEELRSMTEEEIDAFYDQSDGKGEVELTQLKESGGKLTMVMDYDSVEAYNDFNETTLFFGTIEEALKLKDKNYFSEENLIRVKDSSEVKTADVIKDTSLSTVVFEEDVLYELDKKILYHSENVELISGKCARLKDAEKGLGYLIY